MNGVPEGGPCGLHGCRLGVASLEDLRKSTGAEEHVVFGTPHNGALFRRVELHCFELAQCLAGTRQLPLALGAITVLGWSEVEHCRVLIRQ